MNTRRKLRDGVTPARWNRYNLIPTAAEFGPVTGEKYREMMIALEAADGRAEVFETLYEYRDAEYVYELEALQTAYHWNDQ